jgi:Sap, sulfolipid-1-addressing protein
LLDQVNRFTSRRSATLGTVLSCANPKVMALSLGAALSVARVRADGLLTLSQVALFVAIGAAGVLAPIAAYLALPSHGAATLATLRGRLAKHERAVLTVFAMAIGAVFIHNGIDSLPS